MSNNIQSKYFYGGVSDVGYMRERNEDFLAFEVLREDILLAVVADGAGSRQCGFEIQPAVIAATEIVGVVKRFFTSNPEFLEKYPIEVLNEAMAVANRTIGVFKVANEDLYSGFGVCATCCLVIGEKFFFAHCGNTRLYMVRHLQDDSARILQLTNDHTLAARMVKDGTLNAEEYYSHPSRNTYTSGLGFVDTPEIQTYSATLKKGDLLALTTDGIHYAINPESIKNIILESDGWESAANALISGAKMREMVDNMTAAIIYYL